MKGGGACSVLQNPSGERSTMIPRVSVCDCYLFLVELGRRYFAPSQHKYITLVYKVLQVLGY